MKKKAAICISSELRNIRYSLPRVKAYFDKYFENSEESWDIDYFVYSPDIYIKNYDFVNKIYDRSYINYVTDDDIKYIEDTLNPKCIEIEKNGEKLLGLIKKFGLNSDDLQNCIRSDSRDHWKNARSFNQYHFAQQVIELKQSYENTHDFKYDAVFRIRPDLYFLDLVNINPIQLKDDRFLNTKDYYKVDWPNSIFVSYIDVRCGCPQVGDHFFMANSYAMDAYHNNMVENLVRFHNELKDNKFTNTMWENLYRLSDPPERKWFLLGFLNKITFVDTLCLSACLIRDHFDKNTWTHNVNFQEKVWKHEGYINNANHIIGLYVNAHGYDYNKLIGYFKENDLFKFKDGVELTNFMKDNPTLFK